ncbi:MAG: C25 family cysteine peptidase [Candidatus Cloacimonetes bacterium]|nr:C25 family cysteine peptidase [Candidatus Cloacimonadota bacterium]
MKRILLILLGLCLVQMYALNPVSPVVTQSFSILQSNNAAIDLRFDLPEYQISEIHEARGDFQRITIGNAGSLQELGMPELPVLSTTIAIPATGGVNLEVLSANERVVSGIRAYPLQDASLPENSRAFSINDSFYDSASSYPQRDIFHSEPMIMRDLRVVTISLSPFVYDAGRQELRVRESMEIRISFNDQPSVNELSAVPQSLSAAFAKIYESSILNFDDYRDLVLANTPPRYLIIHGQTTDNAFLNALNNFALWKRQKGADVDIATTASNQAGSSTSSIQTYIRNRYNNPNTRPDYVILIGDTGGSFAIPAFSVSSGGSDFPYTHMNTGDILGDVFIGRISVENTIQFLVVLNKIYLYERDLDLSTADWLNRMLLVGDNNPSGISTMYISKYIKEMAQEVNPAYSFTEIYGSDFYGMVNGINSAINEGVGFYSFRGYIDFDPPSESALSNAYRLPHAVTITCATGNYSGSLGETEAMLRYGTTALPKGAVTAIGMSTMSTHTTFNNVLHGGIFDGIYTYGMRSMGEAILHGKLYMNEIFGVSSPSNVNSFTHWCNLMGDPTMEVYTGTPDSFQIETLPQIPMGLTLLDIGVSDQRGTPVAEASVVLSLGSTILSRGYTDANGQVILVLPESMSVGAAKVTISKHNFKPLQHDINIQNVATLVPHNMLVDDSQGNDNGIITAGETVNLYFGLKNTGSTSLNRVSGTLHTDSPWVQIIQGSVSYPPLAGGSSAQNTNPLVIHIAPNTPDETMLRLHLLLGDGMGGSYDVSEFIPVESARAIFISAAIPGGEVLDPGESAEFALTIQNTGASVVHNVYGQLISQNDLLEVTDENAYFGSLPLNTSVSTTTDAFALHCLSDAIPGMQLPLQLRLFNAEGFEQFITFNYGIGTVSSQHPLGPDAYGYVIYDWTDTSYPEAPVYEWVEIAPQLGGFGTALPITDTYYGGDEGDQVNASSLAMVDLPFAFQFYGLLYHQITVCSNGFIALGETGNGEFRNFRLPGAMGPSPMIAAFWDDLATRNGSSISYWYDGANHRFIVEWYNLVNGKNGTAVETFQIILYDQDFHYSSLGDGPIKIQYQTFNNVDSQSGSNHGNYCTIGIEDHTGTRGLEYTFNNIYPTAAATLGNNKAIYITNNPSLYDAPVITSELPDCSLNQGEDLLLQNLTEHFYSSAYLSFELLPNPNVSASQIPGGLKLSPDPAFYGITDLQIKATDPMGRSLQQSFQLLVHQATGQNQDFDAGTLPTGWVIQDQGTSGQTWQILAQDRDGYWAKVSVGTGAYASDRLTTSSYNLSGYDNTRLRFWMDYQPLSSVPSTLYFSLNNSSWTTIDSYTEAYCGYKEYSLPILNNRPRVYLRWTYTTTFNSAGVDNHWIIDDISLCNQIQDQTPPTIPGNPQLLSAADATVNFSWNPSSDPFFSHYEVYLASGSTVDLDDTLYSMEYNSSLALMETDQLSISGLANGQYTLAIRALDIYGNASELSAPLRFLLGSYPAAVENLRISRSSNSYVLNWNVVNTDLVGNPLTVSGYRVYASESPEFELNQATLITETSSNSLNLPDSASPSGMRFFRVTAYID